MKNEIQRIEDLIQVEKKSLSIRLAELKQSNADDQELLDTYVQRFTHAVQDSLGEKAIQKLQSDRNDAMKRVEQNNEIIRILSADEGSKIKRLSADLVGERFKAIELLESEAASLHDSLREHHKALAAGLSKLNALNKQSRVHKLEIDRTNIDSKDAQRFGLIPGRKLSNENYKGKITAIIKELTFSAKKVLKA